MNPETHDQRVYLIDDDEAVRDAMSMLLNSADYAYHCFESAEDFLQHHDVSWRGCLILDIRMPGLSGLELQKRLLKTGSNLPIIFITGHGDVPMAVEAMRQGAIDFLRKPISEVDLLNRIQQALEHESNFLEQTEFRKQNLARVDSLTQREKQIFRQVAEGQANKAIAIDFGISERTVEVHRSQVMKKLEAKTLAQLVRIYIDLEHFDER
jgi:two-component system response regulator FixJ